jgi:anti-anti-sigma factor
MAASGPLVSVTCMTVLTLRPDAAEPSDFCSVERAALSAPARLTRDATPALREEMLRQIASAAATGADVVIDCADVELCDANGLGVLVGARLRARAQGVNLVIQRPSATLVRAARVTRLYPLLFRVSSSG